MQEDTGHRVDELQNQLSRQHFEHLKDLIISLGRTMEDLKRGREADSAALQGLYRSYSVIEEKVVTHMKDDEKNFTAVKTSLADQRTALENSQANQNKIFRRFAWLSGASAVTTAVVGWFIGSAGR